MEGEGRGGGAGGVERRSVGKRRSGSDLPDLGLLNTLRGAAVEPWGISR